MTTPNLASTALTSSNLSETFKAHVQASIRLIKVALELEWTVFTRFIAGVIMGAFLSIIYLIWTLHKTKHPLVVWERLN
jgi:MFS superfamily sulfate permease-like transporter